MTNLPPYLPVYVDGCLILSLLQVNISFLVLSAWKKDGWMYMVVT